jgi:hypothetical protein
VPTLTPATVVSVRTKVLWIVRAVALVLLVVGAYFLVNRVLFATITADWSYALKTFSGIGTFHPFHAGVALVVIGATLGLFSRRIAAWLTPAPIEGCPNCGFSRGDDDPTRCTECGLPGVNKK